MLGTFAKGLTVIITVRPFAKVPRNVTSTKANSFRMQFRVQWCVEGDLSDGIVA